VPWSKVVQDLWQSVGNGPAWSTAVAVWSIVVQNLARLRRCRNGKCLSLLHYALWHRTCKSRWQLQPNAREEAP
jgi:hypothetical protein